MILVWVLVNYFKDVKEIGKEDLAVPLFERLLLYLGMFGIPIGVTIIYILYHIIF